MRNRSETSLLGLNFCRQISQLVTPGSFGSFQPNHYHLTAVSTFNFAMENSEFKEILNSGVVICDSKPIFLTLKSLRTSVEMIRGADFMRAVLKSDLGTRRHFLIGSNPDQLFKLSRFIAINYPKVQVSGAFSPPITDHETIIGFVLQIRELQMSDIVWVGLGSPKQDFVAAEISRKLNITAVGIGAAFDYLSGNIKEAPSMFRSSGFEWFYRLVLEPRRLWRRYLIGNSKFLWLAFRALLQSFR